MKKASKKDVILEVAMQLFSENGYDGTSMDDIAQKASVTKSLIYYHFKSKEDLLDTIIGNFFNEYKRLLSTEKDKISSERTKNYLNFSYKNKDFIKILIVESLKNNIKNICIFPIVKSLMEYESELTGNKDLLDYDKNHQRWVAEFFTHIIPSALFACYKSDWCTYFETTESQLEEDFLDVVSLTHNSYHESLDREKED